MRKGPLTEGPLRVESPAFSEGESIPRQHTGYGADRSPELHLTNLTPAAVSLALLLDDLDVLFLPVYSHWVVWNLPRMEIIPGGMPPGALLPSGARQGRGYGRHRYRGPMPPFFDRRYHRYRFTCYALDTTLELRDGGRRELLAAMAGHVLQEGSLTGLCRWERKQG